jgi:hypothetical protein
MKRVVGRNFCAAHNSNQLQPKPVLEVSSCSGFLGISCCCS